MALSNWDSLAIGPDGKSAKTSFKIGEHELEIYKNWLYVIKGEDEKDRDVVQINAGDIHTGPFSIQAKRGSQDSILFVASHYIGKDEDSENWGRRYFAGIGCYGFGDRFEEYCKLKGIEYIPYEFSTSIEGKSYVGYWDKEKNPGDREVLVEIEEEFDLNPWVGVLPETLEELKSYIQEVLEPDLEWNKNEAKWFNSIDWDNLTRANQGDLFFQDKLGLEPQETLVGEQGTPIIMKMIKGKGEAEKAE
jgi:hypothetical protein